MVHGYQHRCRVGRQVSKADGFSSFHVVHVSWLTDAFKNQVMRMLEARQQSIGRNKVVDPHRCRGRGFRGNITTERKLVALYFPNPKVQHLL